MKGYWRMIRCKEFWSIMLAAIFLEGGWGEPRTSRIHVNSHLHTDLLHPTCSQPLCWKEVNDQLQSSGQHRLERRQVSPEPFWTQYGGTIQPHHESNSDSPVAQLVLQSTHFKRPNFWYSTLDFNIKNQKVWCWGERPSESKVEGRWRMASSGMFRRVALVRTVVSEELSAPFIRVTRLTNVLTWYFFAACVGS
jgi:hypothetical protein